MKTIKQIADKIGVSPQAVYDKIKKEPLASALNEFTEKVGNVLNFKLDGVKLIESAFNEKRQLKTSNKTLDNFSQDLIDTLKQQIGTLTKQLETKDEQLKEKDEQINKILTTIKIQAESINSMQHLVSNAQLLHAKEKAQLSEGTKKETVVEQPTIETDVLIQVAPDEREPLPRAERNRGLKGIFSKFKRGNQ